ncbi:IS21-like element IS21 family transposase (plasmid) [Escherichia coli]|nr:IS21-like element IS21 family transposase [Escherichia coli]CAK1261428.1 IS21-like element IS21 family transposase [Escherichia coli]CAK5251339.1 IS21-like element IS21 family transposase [Escherichia coli]
MLSREDFYMIKQMRQQGAYIVDIAAQIGCSERTVRRYLKYPEPPARKTRHKMVKLKPFMDYIDMRLAENVWNSEVIFAEIKAMGYTADVPCCVTTSSPNVKCVRQKEQGESYRLKEKRKAGVLTKNTTPISDDEMVQSGQHQ